MILAPSEALVGLTCGFNRRLRSGWCGPGRFATFCNTAHPWGRPQAGSLRVRALRGFETPAGFDGLWEATVRGIARRRPERAPPTLHLDLLVRVLPPRPHPPLPHQRCAGREAGRALELGEGRANPRSGCPASPILRRAASSALAKPTTTRHPSSRPLLHSTCAVSRTILPSPAAME
jgi:hypothetical protein